MCMKVSAPSYPKFTNREVCSHTIIFTHTQKIIPVRHVNHLLSMP